MAVRVAIEVPELGRLIEKLDGDKVVKRRVRSLLRKAGNVVRAEMRRQAPRGERRRASAGQTRSRTRLARSIKVTARPDSVLIRPAAFHTRFVERGTRPHVIKASRAKALRFGTFYARSVNHPGAKANPFVERTRKKVEGDVAAILREGAAEIKREFDAR